MTVAVANTKPDRLDEMMAKQNNLIHSIWSSHDRFLETRFKGSVLYDLCSFLMSEAIELQNETQWKWWKVYSEKSELDMPKIHDEIADLLHVILHIAIMADMDADSLYDAYVKKNKVNLKRQTDHY